MGVLRAQTTRRRVALPPRCLIGRSRKSDLVLKDEATSSEHASIYFLGGGWKLRDLASRNGTYLNGAPIEAGAGVRLDEGDRVAFGSLEEEWVLEDSSEPAPSALGKKGERQWGELACLWLPDVRDPQMCVRMESGGWYIEDSEGQRHVSDGDHVVVDGAEWELELPDQTLSEAEASTASTKISNEPDSLEAVFRVASDEEHVSLEVKHGGEAVSLGARSHNYGLLLLARERLRTAAEGVSAGEAGWVYVADLSEMLRLDRKAMNLQIWRAKQAFQKAGLPADQLIERRPDSLQIRIGVERCLILPA